MANNNIADMHINVWVGLAVPDDVTEYDITYLYFTRIPSMGIFDRGFPMSHVKFKKR